MAGPITCFKAYDVRGRVPDELNEEVVYRIGRGYAQWLKPDNVVVGRDIRHTSAALSRALCRGLNDAGVDVRDIGQCGTEEVYFATAHTGAGGGIMVTASHNPPDYNGLKFVREESKPISGDSGLKEIQKFAERAEFPESERHGSSEAINVDDDYIAHLLGYIEVDRLRPLRIVANAGNGGAGKVVDLLEPLLPHEFIKVHHEPDPDFPNGVPNPLLPENRGPTIDAIREHRADIGIAWDGDYDRCFFFDERGEFIEGYYVVGLLASKFLMQHANQKIVHDPRLTWNTIAIADEFGGEALQSKTGHAFIKEAMRAADAVYGGEMSAHHYFRDFAYCDSGMIPWLLVTEIMSLAGKPLSALVAERQARFPASGEINRRIADPAATLAAVEAAYGGTANTIDHTDGLSMEFDEWRFNLRSSNTEPLVRLNVESRGNRELMQEKTAELLARLDAA